jgi:hypothetical protein
MSRNKFDCTCIVKYRINSIRKLSDLITKFEKKRTYFLTLSIKSNRFFREKNSVINRAFSLLERRKYT